jgi:hypothetical protein
LSNANVPGLRIIIIRNALCNDRGFYPKEKPEIAIEWNQIIRVAQLVWIDDIALETEDYWAFQSSDPHGTCWVLARYGFTKEIVNRYGNTEMPHITHGRKTRFSGGLLYSCVVWPRAEIGEDMYVKAKKRFWELERKIAYRNT